MREYYVRFVKEVGRCVFIFWKAQVAGGMFAGVVTAIISGAIGISLPRVVTRSVAAVVCGYLALLGIAFIRAIMRAPVNLDQKRSAEIALARAAHQKSTEQAQFLLAENIELQKPKRPKHEQIRYEKAQSAIKGMAEHELMFLQVIVGREEIEIENLHQELRQKGVGESE